MLFKKCVNLQVLKEISIDYFTMRIRGNSEKYGYCRVAAVVPRLRVGDVDYNVSQLIEEAEKAINGGARIVVFPELALTGYTCGDLLLNDALLDAVEQAIEELTMRVAFHGSMVVVGAPLRNGGHLFNCAVVIGEAQVVGVVPKTYIPNYREFYEKRWMTSALAIAESIKEIKVAGEVVPFGTDLIFDFDTAHVAIDVCEDLWAPIPPSSVAAVNGANIILNLSASNEVVGKHRFLDDLICHQSSQTLSAYVYASAGYGESTTDLVYAGKGIIAENGTMIAETERFTRDSKIALADIDLQLIEHERRVNTSYSDSVLVYGKHYRHLDVLYYPIAPDFYDVNPILHPIAALPFVPTDKAETDERCEEIINIQTFGLMRRLEHTGIKRLVIGVSGGLDSTLALLVAVAAFDRLSLDRKGIYAITMPGFGTSGRTHDNALQLMRALGVTYREISIADAVKQHFKDIEHDINEHDVTYENSQARERTQILMDLANKVGALVLGTGDLSELALGWATYNGDHMSMYNVNGSIPKTLARHLVSWLANTVYADNTTVNKTLLDVVATPISPELTPTDAQGNIAQKTEEIVGPYELNDFFLFNMLRHGYTPLKIYRLAVQAFEQDYNKAEIKHWLSTFIRRFFSQQFKRSCLPDGPKVGTVSLSPRGDWRMPSDACATLWLKECEAISVE